MVVPFLIFCRTCIPFSTVAVPMIYQQCTNSAQRFPFLDNLAKLWYLLSFDNRSSNWCEMTSLVLLMCISLMITGIELLLMYLLAIGNVCFEKKNNTFIYIILPFLNQIVFTIELYDFFWILIPYQIYGSHTFSPSVSCLFVLMVLFAIQYFSSLM